MYNRSALLVVLSVVFLVSIGIVMLISTSAFEAGVASVEDPYRDVWRQLWWLGLGAVACLFFASVDYHVWQRFAWVIYLFAIVLLALCFVPLIGQRINGEYRWISAKSLGLPDLSMQPSEFGKLALVIVVSFWLAKFKEFSGTFFKGFVLPLSVAGVLISLVLAEVDMGTSAIMSAVCLSLLFLAGTRWYYLAGVCGAGAMGFATLVTSMPDRMERLTAFMDLEAHRAGAGLQQFLALMAFGSGGISGMGLGNGRLKMAYMPFANTDFIFPMVGEELGLGFTLLVVFAFVLFAVAGILISFHAPDAFGKLLGMGIVCLVVFQAILNIGVTTAVLPNTGLPLPFVSKGGSNLMAALMGVGILLNIYRQGVRIEPGTITKLQRERRYTPRV